jgi:hypothetical protein
MNLWPRKQKPIRTSWEYEPYAFEPGRKYVIEVNIEAIDMEALKGLSEWISDNGLNVKLVPSKTRYRALQPLEVKRMTTEEPQ